MTREEGFAGHSMGARQGRGGEGARPGQAGRLSWLSVRTPHAELSAAHWTVPCEVPPAGCSSPSPAGQRPSRPAPPGWHLGHQIAVSALVDGFKYLHVASGEWLKSNYAKFSLIVIKKRAM